MLRRLLSQSRGWSLVAWWVVGEHMSSGQMHAVTSIY